MWEATIGVDVCSRAGALGGLEDRNEAFHRFLSALLLLILGLMAPASAKPASGELDLYTVRGEPAQAGQLVREGLDVVGSRVAGDKIELDIVLSDAERDRLVARGFSVLPRRTKDGKTSASSPPSRRPAVSRCGGRGTNQAVSWMSCTRWPATIRSWSSWRC
jgi:hypothetical protein